MIKYPCSNQSNKDQPTLLGYIIMDVYLDNAATTRVSAGAAQAMMQMLTEDYGNPSSLHNKGFIAEKAVEESRMVIANAMKVQKNDLFFTSGGTESNNMVLHGIIEAYKRSGNHILISDIEHASVKDAAFHYEALGYEVTCVPVDAHGYIDPLVLASMVREDTILVSIMHVNNEIGTIQPMASLVKAVKDKNAATVFHVDAVQSFGKYLLYPSRIGVDLMTVSAHKIHGPKGVGALYVSPKVRLIPLVYGGDQQKGVRSGTENVPGIVGFGIAAKEAYEQMDQRQGHISDLRKYCANALLAKIEDVAMNSDLEKGAYHILNIRVIGVKSEVLLHTLEEAGIYVSTGSACSSNKKHHSSTLQALGQKGDATDQAIRLSFSKDTTKEEIDYLVNQLVIAVPMLRRFKKK